MPPTSPQLRWIRPPQQARSQETLGRLLDSAEALMADKGFEDVSVAEIARRAGSSVGAFYSRFRDKDGLLYGLYERHLEQATATADDALVSERWQGAGVEELVAAVVQFLVTTYRERAGLMRAFVLRNHTDIQFRERQDRLSHYVSAKLSVLLLERSDEIQRVDPNRAAAFGLSMVFATIEANVLFGETRSNSLHFSDDELARELTHAYLAYLGVAPAGPQANR